MMKAISNGLTPYKDFFFAHPPLQLYLFSSFSFSLKSLKFAVIIWNSLVLLEMFIIGKLIFDEKTGMLSSIFLLIFPGFLIFGSLGMGTFESLIFVGLTYIYYFKKRYTTSSLFFLLSVFTRYLSLLVLVSLAFIAILTRKL